MYAKVDLLLTSILKKRSVLKLDYSRIVFLIHGHSFTELLACSFIILLLLSHFFSPPLMTETSDALAQWRKMQPCQ